jgi:hypothetical protein
VPGSRRGNPRGMDTESREPENRGAAGTPPAEDAGTRSSAPPLPVDPRVPRPEDADPSTSKELGGAAPVVGPGAGGPD